MADLKAVFVIMLMMNIGISIVYNLMDLDDFQLANTKSNSTLTDYFLGGTGSLTPNPTQTIANTSEMGKPITEDSLTDQVVLRSDSPLKMISQGLVMILTSAFGVLYVLIALGSPAFVIWLIGVPFTLIYVISGVMFVRGVN